MKKVLSYKYTAFLFGLEGGIEIRTRRKFLT